MATADSVKAKIQGLIDTSNATTGQSDTDLTSAVNHLKEGYGQGGTADPLEGYFDGSLTEINLPNITKIKQNAFREDRSITNVIMPKVETIEEKAFANCSNLALSQLPSGLKSIWAWAFQYCSKISISEIPSSVTYIGSGAFYSCKGITSLTFKGKPNSIAADAFQSCTNLLTINVPWSEGAVANAPWGATNATIIYDYGKEPEPPAEGDSRTWVFNDTITDFNNLNNGHPANVDFNSNGTDYKCIMTVNAELIPMFYSAIANDSYDSNTAVYVRSAEGTWVEEGYRTITFADDTYKDNATFYAWLQANATQQGSGGGDSGDTNTFTFTIGGKTYTAIEGMDWNEWCESDYNTDGYYCNDMYLGYADCVVIGYNLVADQNVRPINREDTIIENYNYTLWSE